MDEEKLVKIINQINERLTSLENTQQHNTKQLQEIQMYVKYLYLGRYEKE